MVENLEHLGRNHKEQGQPLITHFSRHCSSQNASRNHPVNLDVKRLPTQKIKNKKSRNQFTLEAGKQNNVNSELNAQKINQKGQVNNEILTSQFHLLTIIRSSVFIIFLCKASFQIILCYHDMLFEKETSLR